MDLLHRNSELDINDPTWKIRSRNPIAPPQYIGKDGRAVNSVIVSGCEIEGDVESSILSHDVTVKKGAVIRNSIIFCGAEIGEGAKIEYAIIDENVKIGKNAVIGEDNSEGKITVIGRDLTVSDGKKVGAGTIADKSI